MAVAILYYPNFKIKTILWKLTPYQYNQILYFPNNSIVSATSSQKEKSENLKILKKIAIEISLILITGTIYFF